MAQTIYGIICDGGDGSASVRWYRSQEKVEKLLNDDEQCEWYGQNEGQAKILTFPDDLDLEKCGFSFSDTWRD
jgi:hypothetical protein